jgi:hypothetical protein
MYVEAFTSNQNYRNLLYLAFDLTEGYCYYQQIGSDTGKYESVWCETYHVLLIKTITSDVTIFYCNTKRTLLMLINL